HNWPPLRTLRAAMLQASVGKTNVWCQWLGLAARKKNGFCSVASCHMTNMVKSMTNYKPCVGDQRVVTASQNSFCIAGHGDLIILSPSCDNKEVEIFLQNVTHVPDLGFNLFS
ncbi:unnamed protein product, partial [Choristocarpus tenellus]